MKQLRDYQIAAVQSIFDFFTENETGNPLVCLPTGTGKSLVIAEFCKIVCANWKDQKILVLTHSKELVQQDYNHFVANWPTAPAGIYQAALKRKDTHARITFGSIQSVHNKAHLFSDTNLIIIDEAHRVNDKASTMYQTVIDEIRRTQKHLRIIGLTATPYRLGLGLLTDGALFTDICYNLCGPADFLWLIQQGYLAPLVPKKTNFEYDVDGVPLRKGEYDQTVLQMVVDQQDVTIACLQETVRCAEERKKWLLFATGVQHCQHVSEALTSMGISNTVVTSLTRDTERDAAVEAFKEGRVQCLINNNVFTTGFDVPDVDLIVMLRPTQSPSLWVQMLGRGTRPAAGKANCLVLDFAGNTKRLGPINDPVLPRSRKLGQKQLRPAPVRICPACDAYVHAAMNTCPYCGEEFPKSLKLAAQAGNDALIKEEVLPLIETYTVNMVSYTLHTKAGKPNSMKVIYSCGMLTFNEYVCFDHSAYAKKMAVDWWIRAYGSYSGAKMRIPTTTEEALELSPTLQTPIEIKVWVNTTYPKIMDVTYTEEVPF